MRIAIATLLLAIGLVGQAVSQELDDDAYVNEYFGTTVVFFSPEPLVNSEMEWWADLLPEDLLYGSNYVAGLVNAYRMGKGVDQLVPTDASIVMTGWEAEAVDGSGFDYNIDFIGLRPSEVEMIFQALGGMDQYLGELEKSYWPLLRQDYYEYTEALDAPVEIRVGSLVVEIDTSQHISDVLEQLGELFELEYGFHTITGISLSYSIYDGYESVSLSFSVELPAG